MQTRRFPKSPLAALLLVALLPAPQPATGNAVQPGCSLFKETGKAICGRFLEYWSSHGGLAQQGFPISDTLQEVSETDGQTYTVQYFERAVFEFHPESIPPYDILLSHLGLRAYTQRYLDGAPRQQPSDDPVRVSFPETRKHLGGRFLAYWQANGGLPQFGYPISEEFPELSPLDGKTYTVQYFERAVFEFHPENSGTSHEVLLSQLGTFRHRDWYGPLPNLPAPAPGRTQGALSATETHIFWVDYVPTQSGPLGTADILAWDLQAGKVVTVTDAPGDQTTYAATGPTVVWRDRETIFGKNLLTGESFTVAPAGPPRYGLTMYGQTVAWFEHDGDLSRIFTADLATGVTAEFATLPPESGLRPYGNLSISDEYVVWSQQGDHPTPYLLLVYDRSTHQMQTLASAPGRISGDGMPYSLHTRLYGHLLMMTGRLPLPQGGDWFFYGTVLLDLHTRQMIDLPRSIFTGSGVSIRGNTLVWADLWSDMEGHIWGMNLKERLPVLLSTSPGTNAEPVIAGDWLVWRTATNRFKADWRLTSARLHEAFVVTPAKTTDAEWTVLLNRPVDLPVLAPGEPCVGPTGGITNAELGGIARGRDPIFVVGLGDEGIVPLQPSALQNGWYSLKTTWVTSNSYFIGPILVRGARIDAPGELRFGTAPSLSDQLRLHPKDAT
ncbi:MAG TPA: hypothetical protein VND68_04650, partial [Chloroflexia bacterium]|nr:hypothetical protein [Chloroflexia bacterium]